MKNTFSLRLLASLCFGIGVPALAFLSSPISAQAVECPFCAMNITPNSATQDNQVTLKQSGKSTAYKCVYCAISDAKSQYPSGSLSILAPGEKKGHPVVLKRENGRWIDSPSSAVFVSNSPLKHHVCNVQARAFTTKAAAQAYIAKNGLNAKPLTLAQMLAFVK